MFCLLFLFVCFVSCLVCLLAFCYVLSFDSIVPVFVLFGVVFAFRACVLCLSLSVDSFCSLLFVALFIIEHVCSLGCFTVRRVLLCRRFFLCFLLVFVMVLFVCCCCVFAAFCYLDCRTRLWFALFSGVVVLFVFGFAVVKFVGMLYCLCSFVCLLMCVSLWLFVCCVSAFAHV